MALRITVSFKSHDLSWISRKFGFMTSDYLYIFVCQHQKYHQHHVTSSSVATTQAYNSDNHQWVHRLRRLKCLCYQPTHSSTLPSLTTITLFLLQKWLERKVFHSFIHCEDFYIGPTPLHGEYSESFPIPAKMKIENDSFYVNIERVRVNPRDSQFQGEVSTNEKVDSTSCYASKMDDEHTLLRGRP